MSAHDAGFKSRFLNNTVQLHASGFPYDCSGQQIASNIGATSVLRPADGCLFGGEAGLTWQPFRLACLEIAVGFRNSEHLGNDVANGPTLTINAGVELTPRQCWRNELRVRGDARTMSD